MSNFISLLGGIFSPDETKFSNVNMGWLYPVARFLDNLLVPFIIIVLIAGAAWVIVLGVNLAKAEDTGKAQEAKKKLINVAIALVSVIVLVFLLTFLASNLPTWFTSGSNPWSESAQSGTGTGTGNGTGTGTGGNGVIRWFLQ